MALTDPRALAAAKALLPDGPRYVGFAPGAGGQEKRWPLDRYLALAARAEAAGYRPVFFFGPDEADQARAAAPNALYPEFDRTDDFADVRGPLLVIALAGRLTAAVANDAGPGHMLVAGGASLLSLQRTHWLATKFKPSAPWLSLLVAEDFGTDGMAAIPVEAAWDLLRADRPVSLGARTPSGHDLDVTAVSTAVPASPARTAAPGWGLVLFLVLIIAPRGQVAGAVHLTEDESYYRLWAASPQFGYYD